MSDDPKARPRTAIPQPHRDLTENEQLAAEYAKNVTTLEGLQREKAEAAQRAAFARNEETDALNKINALKKRQAEIHQKLEAATR